MGIDTRSVRFFSLLELLTFFHSRCLHLPPTFSNQKRRLEAQRRKEAQREELEERERTSKPAI
jgi:hypothetical protein